MYDFDYDKYEMDELRCDLMNEISEEITDDELEKMEREAISADRWREYFMMMRS
jgi:hypothetical protein